MRVSRVVTRAFLATVLLALLVGGAEVPATAALGRPPVVVPRLVPAADSSTLSVSAPASANLGSAGVGAGQLSGPLGQVVVTETTTATVLHGWTTSVTATPFTTTSGAMSSSIATAQVQYLAGASTSSGVALGSCTTSPVAQTLVSTRVAYSCGGALSVGSSTVRWSPTVTVNFPSTTVAGTYRGTITHSVA